MLYFFRLTERNQKIEFEQERMKKLELEAKVEEYDGIFEKNKEKVKIRKL